MEDYLKFILFGLWFLIGAIVFVFYDKSNPCRTRGEYMTSLIVSALFGPITIVLLLPHTDWWNEEIN